MKVLKAWLGPPGMERSFVLVNTERRDEAFLEALRSLTGVSSIILTVGVYDIICIVDAEEPSKVLPAVTAGVRGMRGVRSTLVLLGHKG